MNKWRSFRMRVPTFIRLALLFGLIVLAGCSGDAEPNGNGLIFGNAGAHLDTNQRIQLEGEAFRGSSEAARRLILHYMYAEEDPYQLEIWWTIGMKDGDENAKTSLGWLLATGQGAFPNVYLVTAESCKRGRALLEEAKNDGDTAAMSMLKRVPYDCNIENQAPLTRG